MKTHDKDFAVRFYLDYVNNYLTVEKIAEHYGVSMGDAFLLIGKGRDLHEERVKALKG